MTTVSDSAIALAKGPAFLAGAILSSRPRTRSVGHSTRAAAAAAREAAALDEAETPSEEPEPADEAEPVVGGIVQRQAGSGVDHFAAI